MTTAQTSIHVSGPDHRTRVLHFNATPTPRLVRCALAAKLGVRPHHLRLTSEGRPLPMEDPREAGEPVMPSSPSDVTTMLCSVKVVGGGGDGGSYMDRRDCCPHIKEKKAEPKKPDPLTKQKMMWSVCKLTNDPLGDSVYADELGFLYAANSIVQKLIAKKTDPSAWPKEMAHVGGLSDLIKLQLTINPHAEKKVSVFVSDVQKSEDEQLNKWVCPILTDISTNGAHKFATFKKCGHVVSMKAVAAEGGVDAATGVDVKAPKTGVCPVCRMEYVSKDKYMEAVQSGEADVCENILVQLTPLPDNEEVKNWKEFRLQQKKKRKAEGKEGDKGKGKGEKSKRQKTDIKGQKIAPTVSRDAPAPGASAAVWQSIFHDEKTKPQETSYLVRAGMRSTI